MELLQNNPFYCKLKISAAASSVLVAVYSIIYGFLVLPRLAQNLQFSSRKVVLQKV